MSVPFAFEKCEESKRVYNFERAAAVLRGEELKDKAPPGYPFDDLGHLYEAAVAHYQATGKRTLLDVALRTAELLDRTFGPGKQSIWNMSAYNETCAAIGNDYWNHRLFLLHADAKYVDVMERTLYNGK